MAGPVSNYLIRRWSLEIYRASPGSPAMLLLSREFAGWLIGANSRMRTIKRSDALTHMFQFALVSWRSAAARDFPIFDFDSKCKCSTFSMRLQHGSINNKINECARLRVIKNARIPRIVIRIFIKRWLIVPNMHSGRRGMSLAASGRGIKMCIGIPILRFVASRVAYKACVFRWFRMPTGCDENQDRD